MCDNLRQNVPPSRFCPSKTQSVPARLLIFLSSRPMKSTWRDQVSRFLVNTSWKSRLDEIQDFVFLSSHPHQIDLTRFRILSSRPEEVDLTRFMIFSSCLLVLKKSTWRDSGSFLLVFSSCRSRFDEIQDLFFLSSHPHQVDFTRSRNLSSCLLILTKSTWRDPVSCLLVFSSWRSRLDKIQDLVFLSSRPDEVDLTRSMILSSCLLILMKSTSRDPGTCLLVFSSWRSRLDEIQYLVFLSSRPDEVDLTRFRILSSCLLVLTKSTWRDPGSCLLVFSSWRSRLDEIQDLVFLSSRHDEVDLTRFRIVSSCLLILIESTRRDPGSCLLVFSSWRSWLDEIEDLVFLSSCLVFLSSWLICSSSRLVFSSSLPDLSRLLGALLSFRTFFLSSA